MGPCPETSGHLNSYDGGAPIGPAQSPVLLECATGGPVPLPRAVPRVVWRAGLDLNPLDAGDAEDMRWLESLIWPGPARAGRVERLRAAASVAAAEPPLLVRGNLLEALPGLVAKAPGDATLVVFHSAVAAYLSVQERTQFEQMMGELGGHWISNEGGRVFSGWEHVQPPEPTDFTLAVDGRVVAYTGEHGQSVTWR